MPRGRNVTVVVSVVVALAGLALLGWVVASGRLATDPGRTVRVGVYENPPKIFTGQDGQPAGLFPVLLEQIAREEGWTLDWVPCAWADCLDQLTAGDLDLMPDVAFSAERAEPFDFHRVSVANSWSQVYAAPGLAVSTLADLSGKRVALLSGGIQQSFFTDLMAASDIPYTEVPVDSLADGYQAVVDGRADAVVTNSFFAAYNGSQYQLQETPIVFLPSTLYFATGNDRNADLLAALDANLSAWRGDAESIYFDAVKGAMAAPPQTQVPRWIQWSLGGLMAVVLLVGAMVLLLRYQVNQRTAELLQTARELDRERANLEEQVVARTAELSAAKDEAERLARVKGDFLATMSHEIRTPMNAVLGMLYLALQTDLPETARDQLGKAQGAARSLLRVINDVLDSSKIDAGKLTLEQVEFDVESVLEALVDSLGHQAERKGVEFLIRCDPAIPPTLVGDPLRLGQVLLNLCGNAVKFTDRGQIELALRPIAGTARAADQITLEVSVTDSGIGMSEQEQQRLFTSFTQADQSTTRRYGGTGLGLTISRSLVELMGGRLWIERSEPGVGTTMRFTATFGVADGVDRPHRDLVARAGPMLAGVRALVVDDNQVSREILTEMLRHFRVDVVSATSGPEALTVLSDRSDDRAPVDLVLLDWFMPAMTGDEVARRIHDQLPQDRRPRIVMVTAYGRDDVMRRAEQVGVDAFLVKPVSQSTLLDSVLTVLGRDNLATEAVPTGPATRQNAPRLAGARVLLVEDNDINREFATALLTGLGMAVDQATDGRQAVDLVAREAYDAVLMDIQMPVLDGYSAAREIRAMAAEAGGEHLAALPIIAMTALAMSGDERASLDAGMNDHVTKPIDPDVLTTCLARWIHPAARSGDAADQPTRLIATPAVPALPGELSRLSSLDAREGVYRIGGSTSGYIRQLRRFRSHYARAADDARGLLDTQGPVRAEEYLHGMKGVAGTIAAHRLHEVVTEIDDDLKLGDPGDADQWDRFRRELDAVLVEIDTLPDPDLPTSGTLLTADEVSSLLGDLIESLGSDLGSADAILRRLRAGTSGTGWESAVIGLAARFDDLDIDAALREARELAGHVQGIA